MHYSLFCTIFFLLIYSYKSFALCEAGRQTVLVLGHSDYNLLKISFVQRLVNDTDVVEKAFDECGAASFLTFHSDESGTLDKHINHHLVQATFLNRQTCTVTITTKGTDEMSLEELQTLQEMIYYVNSGLIVIEIGNKATQTTVILEHSTFCWGITSLHIDIPNTVLLCNDVKISETPLLNGAKIKTLFENDNNNNDQQIVAASTITWPSLFPSVMASADSPTEKKIRSSKKTAQKSARELYYKKGRKMAIHYPDEPEMIDIEHLRKKEKKVACKYRKSCYETGILPNLKAEKTIYKTEESTGNTPDIDEIDEDDTLALKVLCKYRTSCYAEIGMDMTEANHKKSKGVLTAKKTAFLETDKQRPRKKESVREIARKAVKEVEEKDREDPKAKISVIEKHLTETEEKLQMKNKCKYRKSCYESGKLPEVDGYGTPSWLSITPIIDYASVYLNKGEKPEEELSFEEKNELQKKVYCKYRKSFYDTGIAPKIDQTQKFHFEEVVERAPAQIPLQVRCKYRKSCYETGILPDFKKPVKNVEIKPKPLPVTVEDLKLFCKYRKSCYRQKALEVPEVENDENEKDEQMSNDRILVEEVTDTDDNDASEPEEVTVAEKAEEVVEEVIDEVPKKVKKLKQKLMPTIITSENENEMHSKKKSKFRHMPDDDDDNEEEQIRKSKKSKSKEPEPTTTKKSKSRKSSEVETIEEEIIPEHISAFDGVNEFDENEKVIVEEDPPEEEEAPKKETKPKKPKKKPSKNEQAASKSEEDQQEEDKKDFDAGSVTLKEKLHCKYRKSCYETKIPPHIRNDPLAWHSNIFSVSSNPQKTSKKAKISEERWNQLSEQQRKVECKYRQSCYETRQLPPIRTSNDGIWNVKHVFADRTKRIDPDITPEEWKKRSERKRKVLCKYRKSCYDTGKLPKIERSSFFSSTSSQKIPTETKEVSKDWANKKENERKVECKYRKSCYESGKLPPLSPATVETVIESIHDNPKETLQQRCKYRKSCYAAAAELKKSKHEQKSKPGVIDEETLIVKNAKTSQIKEKSTEKADTSGEEQKRSKKADSKSSKKQKASTSKKQKDDEDDDDDESKEEQYKEIPQEEAKPKVNATELSKNITTRLKLACKYRQSCYLSAVTDHLPPEQIMRMRGIKCSKYRISCREQLGLPPLIRAPIGPNGRKLCRKKKPEENSLKM
jgi:hypothetical protein